MLSENDRVTQFGQATKEKLKNITARIQRLESEKAELAADIREIYAEAKSFGFDTKVLRRVIADEKLDANERAEREALTEMYRGVLQGDLFKSPVEVSVEIVSPSDVKPEFDADKDIVGHNDDVKSQAWNNGYDAQVAGVNQDQSPYDSNHLASRLWNEGYTAAKNEADFDGVLVIEDPLLERKSQDDLDKIVDQVDAEIETSIAEFDED